MRVLFDQGTPAPLRHCLSHHQVATAFECGWAKLKNGELLDAAEKSGFVVLVTTDMNLKYQVAMPKFLFRRDAQLIQDVPATWAAWTKSGSGKVMWRFLQEAEG